MEEATRNEARPPESPPESITFHYIKSGNFRVIHCDGAIGSGTPNGKYIHATLFSERNPIPVEVTHQVTDSQIGKQVGAVTRNGVIREMEVDLVMDIETARALSGWFKDMANTLEKLRDLHQSAKDAMEGKK